MARVTIRHLGRESRAALVGCEAELRRLDQALVDLGFVRRRKTGEPLLWYRSPALLNDDWPMRVAVRRVAGGFEVRYGHYVPWAWILGFVALMVVALPFAGIHRAELVGLVGALAAVLGIRVRTFDCAPTGVTWQAATRRRWGETIEQALRDAFDAPATVRQPPV